LTEKKGKLYRDKQHIQKGKTLSGLLLACW